MAADQVGYSKNWKLLQERLKAQQFEKHLQKSLKPKKVLNEKQRKKRQRDWEKRCKRKETAGQAGDMIEASSEHQKNEKPQLSYAEMASKNKVELFSKDSSSSQSADQSKKSQVNLLTKCLAIDCEYVGVGSGGTDDMLARVSVVNSRGEVVFDSFVRPTETVQDFRTSVSGIRPSQLKAGADFASVQQQVSSLLTGRTLVGHAVHNDLRVLGLSHPKRTIRDTSKYPLFRHLCKTRGTPSLKKVALAVLGIEIQQGEHDSVTDAKITMQIYQLHRKEWETSLKKKSR